MRTNVFAELLGVFRKKEKPTLEKELFQFANEILRNALSGASWCLYVTAVLLVASCIYYYYFERKDRNENSRRVRDIQQLTDRRPPKRRPGAVVREREVFRRVLEAAHAYIYPRNEKKAYVVRQTRSGTIYGKFEENKKSEK